MLSLSTETLWDLLVDDCLATIYTFIVFGFGQVGIIFLDVEAVFVF